MTTVFVSHKSTDLEVARELAKRLAERGIESWVDDRNLLAGDSFQPRIESALSACNCCAVLVGPTGLGPWQTKEIEIAFNRAHEPRPEGQTTFRVIPVLLPGAKPEQLTPLLKTLSFLQFGDTLEDGDAFERLVQAITGQPAPLRPLVRSVDSEPPYRGLEAFDEKHAALFFGRKAVTARLLSDLTKATAGSKRLLGVLGPSGSGKSSLARAGLMSAVRAERTFANWKLITMRPGSSPLESLALALAELGSCGKLPADIRQLKLNLLAQDEALHLCGRVIFPDPASGRVLLLVDQFEEIFTAVPGARPGSSQPVAAAQDSASFVKNLLYAVTAPEGAVVVILTLRTDFLGKCAVYPDLSALLAAQSVLVGPMTEAELQEAIQEPAWRAGCEVKPDLVQVLLADVRKAAGGLPLLQDALLELWNRGQGRYLTLEDYRAIGGLEGALEARADNLVAELAKQTPGVQDLLRKIFLRLVQPGEGTADTRKRVPLAELMTVGDSATVRNLIETLASSKVRLLVTENDPERPERACVEVAHETLISQWSQLRRWIEADRPGFRMRHRLTQAAADWQANRRDRSYLYTGTRLALAEDWIEDHSEELTRLERRFLRASQAWRAQTEKRQARERRWRHQLLTGLCLVLIVVVLLTLAAVHQGGIAQARMVARHAVSQLPLDPQLSVLLAARAAELRPAESEDILRQALVECPLRAQFEVGGEVLHVSFSPDGQRIAAGDWAGTSVLYTIATRDTALLIPAHASTVNCVQFSPDGSVFLTAGADALVQIREANTGKLLTTFSQHRKSIRHAEFTRDGRFIVSSGQEPNVWVWDPMRPDRCTCLRHSAEVELCALDPKGDLIATTELGSRSISIWNWREQTRSTVALPEPFGMGVSALEFSANSELLLVAGIDGIAQVWDLAQKGWTPPLRHLQGVLRAGFSPSGDAVLTLTEDGAVRLCDWKTARVRFDLRHRDKIVDACFSADGQLIATGGLDGEVGIWSTADGSSFAQFRNGGSQVSALAFSPDGQFLATGSQDGKGRVWELRLGRQWRLGMEAKTAMLGGQSRRVMLADDHTVSVWELSSGTNLFRWVVTNVASHTVLSSDGNSLCAPGSDGVHVRRVVPETRPETFVPTQAPVSRVALASDGLAVAAFLTNGMPLLVALPSTRSLLPQAPSDRAGSVEFAVWDNHGRVVLTVDSQTNCVVRDTATWRILNRWAAPNPVQCACFNPVADALAVGALNGVAFVWKWRNTSPSVSLIGHSESVNAIAFSPDAAFILTGSSDKTARLWNSRNGFCFATLRGQLSKVLAVGFEQTAEKIVTVGADGTVRDYSCPESSSGQTLLTLAKSPSRATRALTGAERQAFIPGRQRLLFHLFQ